MNPKALFISAAALLLTACATPGRYTNANLVNQYGTLPAVVNRIAQGSRLSVSDIAEMGRRGVPDSVILDTLRSRSDVYRLTASQVKQLQDVGVGAPVIDHLLASRELNQPRQYWAPSYRPYGHRSLGHFGGHYRGGHR